MIPRGDARPSEGIREALDAEIRRQARPQQPEGCARTVRRMDTRPPHLHAVGECPNGAELELLGRVESADAPGPPARQQAIRPHDLSVPLVLHDEMVAMGIEAIPIEPEAGPFHLSTELLGEHPIAQPLRRQHNLWIRCHACHARPEQALRHSYRLFHTTIVTIPGSTLQSTTSHFHEKIVTLVLHATASFPSLYGLVTGRAPATASAHATRTAPRAAVQTCSTDSRGWGCGSPPRAARCNITGDSRSNSTGAAKGPAEATHTPTPARHYQVGASAIGTEAEGSRRARPDRTDTPRPARSR